MAAAQLGPIARSESREAVVERLLSLLEEAGEAEADVIVFPELALTTFFPRWFIEDDAELDTYYETEMPNESTKPLFDRARDLGIGLCLGYAWKDDAGERWNIYHLVDQAGNDVARFKKVHIPGHDEHEPEREFQHLERRYFAEGPDGFGVWSAFGGRVGLAICNDRRWPETYRVMGLQGVELVLIGYNTPIHYAPDPSQDRLASFHNALVMQSGAYQNGTWVVGVAKGGVEEGVASLADTSIIAPSGEIVAKAQTEGDELVVADCDLDLCANYKQTLFDFERYRRPEVYGRISGQKGVRFDD